MSITKFKSLQEEIKSLAAEGRAMNPRIQEASGPVRASLRREKAEVGDRARHLLLAYAFLRGVPYAALERGCRGGPSVSLVGSHAERFSPGSSASVTAWYEAPVGEAAPEPEPPCAPPPPESIPPWPDAPARPGLLRRLVDLLVW